MRVGWSAALRAACAAEPRGEITSVAVLGDRRLQIAWDHVAPIDRSDVIAAHRGLAPLKKKAEFARVAVSADGWSIEWRSGIDFGAPQLRRWADEQAGKVMRRGFPRFDG